MRTPFLQSFLRPTARLLVAALVAGALSPALVSLSDGGDVGLSQEVRAQAAPAAAPAAAPGATPTPTPATQQPPAAVATDVANDIVKFAFMMLNPILMLASWLLSPDWTYGDVFNMRPILHKLWILVSNIVYIVFAIALLVIAVLNIFGNQTYQIKTALPKFVGGIIMVPLSWFIVSATLSISNILTASVLNLPYDTIMGNSELGSSKFAEQMAEIKIKNECELLFDKTGGGATGGGATGGGATGGGATGGGATGGGATGGATPAKPSIKCTGELPLTALFESEDDSPYSILYVYAYGIFKVEDLTKISAENSISSLGDLVFGLFSGITMFFIMLLLCIGIVFVLFTRVIQLWIFAILSPLFGLFFFLGENVMGSGDDGFGKYNLKKFIGLAMVPVYISAALSFGMMLCVVVATTDTTKTSSDGTTSYVQLKTEGDKEIITIGRNPETQLKLTVVGMPLGLAKNLAEVKKVGFGALGKILVMIIALVILWMAVVAGAKSSTITAEAISPIENFGKSVGWALAKMPQYASIPLGGGKSLSYQGLWSAGQQFSSAWSSAASTQGSNFGRDLARAMGAPDPWGSGSPAEIAAVVSARHSDLESRDKPTAANAFDAVLTEAKKWSPTFDAFVANSPARYAVAKAVEAMKDVHFSGGTAKSDIVSWLKTGDISQVQGALAALDSSLGGHVGGDGADWASVSSAKDAWKAL